MPNTADTPHPQNRPTLNSIPISSHHTRIYTRAHKSLAVKPLYSVPHLRISLSNLQRGTEVRNADTSLSLTHSLSSSLSPSFFSRLSAISRILASHYATSHFPSATRAREREVHIMETFTVARIVRDIYTFSTFLFFSFSLTEV